MWQSPITFLINGGMNALLKQGMVKCITLCQKPKRIYEKEAVFNT